MKLKRLVIALTSLALIAPAAASAETFDPSNEFELKDWVPIHLGGRSTCRSTRRSSTCCSARR